LHLFIHVICIVVELSIFTSFDNQSILNALANKLKYFQAETVPEHHWRWVHSFYGEELGLTSDDEADYASFGGVSPSTSAMIVSFHQ
jgi:hypothetical protein